MSAAHVLNAEQTGPMQLPMFMHASDYIDSLTGSVDSGTRDLSHVLYQKTQKAKRPKLSAPPTDEAKSFAAHGTGVYHDVEKHGVLSPVQMVHAMDQNLLMGQGGHRAASAFDISENTGRDMWLSVIHTEGREPPEGLKSDELPSWHTPVSQDPTSEFSEKPARKAAMRDAWKHTEHTPALGHHIGWRQKGRKL